MPTSRSDEPARRDRPAGSTASPGGTHPRRRKPGRDLNEIIVRALRSGAPGILHVRGTSMMPTLKEGTQLQIEPVSPDRIAIGRIAVFLKDEILVVHRMIWKRRSGGEVEYLFKGDNSRVMERVKPGLILGVVSGWMPPGTENGDPQPVPRDPAYYFYHLFHILVGPVLRLGGFLTRGSIHIPRGKFRDLLKKCHSGIESILFRQRSNS